MKISIISFSRSGYRIGEMLSWFLGEGGHEVEAFTKSKYTKKILDESQVEADDKAFRNVKEFAKPIDSSLRDWTGRRFAQSDAIIFIGACGIAVRSIAPFVSSKKTDPAVVVIDEQGKFAISLLSGHIGGANELTEEISNLLHATPVITTATDINNKFAVDVFAKTNGCYISDMTMAKEISAAVLEGEKIACLIEDQDIIIEGKIPKELIICRSREVWEPYPYKVKLESFREKRTEKVEESGKMKNLDAEKEGFLLLRTRNIAAGIGCRKGISEEVLEQGLKEVLKEYGLEMEQLCGLASIDLKKEEAGLMQLSEKYKIPFVTYNADELMKIRSVSDSSDFVKKVTGVDNVCERAVRTYVPDGKLICPKYRKEKMTVALVEEPVRIRF